jgi:hypothetical protein
MIVNHGIVNHGIVDQGIVDNRAPEPGPSQLEPAGAGDSDPERLRITVILTTIEGTMAALRAAANLARGLRAEIVLVVAEVVYFRYPVEHPPVESSFFERLGTALADELQLEGDVFELEIHFCRDRVRCLEQSLPPRSLVMMGAKKCWWRGRERNLERALRQRGYDVVVVRASAPPGEEHAGRVVDRLLRETSAPTRRAL